MNGSDLSLDRTLKSPSLANQNPRTLQDLTRSFLNGSNLTGRKGQFSLEDWLAEVAKGLESLRRWAIYPCVFAVFVVLAIEAPSGGGFDRLLAC